MAGLKTGCKYGKFERHFFHPPQAAYKGTLSTNVKPYWGMWSHNWSRIYNYERLLGRANAVTDLQVKRANLPPLLPLKLEWCCMRLLVCDQMLSPHLSCGPSLRTLKTLGHQTLQKDKMDEQMCQHQWQKAEAGMASLAWIRKVSIFLPN